MGLDVAFGKANVGFVVSGYNGAARGLTVVDWDRRFGAADNARILFDYDQAGFEARVRAALAAS
jgi:inosine-uridine nucleoside N-ribohydrolase